MILVDSSVWVDYFTGKHTAAADKPDSLPGDELVAIGDPMLTEVLRGFRSHRDYRQARTLLLSLTVLNVLDTAIALKSAANFRALRKRGITVRKTIDVIIAICCIESGVPLLHSDTDFELFRKYLGLQDSWRRQKKGTDPVGSVPLSCDRQWVEPAAKNATLLDRRFTRTNGCLKK